MEQMRTRLKVVPNIVLFVNAILIAGAVLRNPPAYYTMLRWVVFGSMIFLVYRKIKESVPDYLLIILIVTGVLFNPIIPFYLNRSEWFWIDIIVSILLLFSIYVSKE